MAAANGITRNKQPQPQPQQQPPPAAATPRAMARLAGQCSRVSHSFICSGLCLVTDAFALTSHTQGSSSYSGFYYNIPTFLCGLHLISQTDAPQRYLLQLPAIRYKPFSPYYLETTLGYYEIRFTKVWHNATKHQRSSQH
jgi:hypothetical protein